MDKDKTGFTETLREHLVDSKSKTTGSTRNVKPKLRFASPKKPHIVAKSTTDVVDSAKSSKTSNSAKLFQNESITEFDKSTQNAVPPSFSSKNIAQERLASLQLSLSINNVDPDASLVFGAGFGIDSAQLSSVPDHMDEEMDWEPCDDANYTFQQLESMAVDVLTESAYIIPDTNVFIDSLASIKSVIEKGNPTE